VGQFRRISALPDTESNSHLRLCKRFGLSPHPARFPEALPSSSFATHRARDTVADCLRGLEYDRLHVERQRWLMVDCAGAPLLCGLLGLMMIAPVRRCISPYQWLSVKPGLGHPRRRHRRLAVVVDRNRSRSIGPIPPPSQWACSQARKHLVQHWRVWDNSLPRPVEGPNNPSRSPCG
jgi:hypothetical protein